MAELVEVKESFLLFHRINKYITSVFFLKSSSRIATSHWFIIHLYDDHIKLDE